MDCKIVLIIEDDAAVRLMLKDILQIEGYQVYTAKDGADGIEQLKIISPQPCLILLDLMMPRTNGWEFLDFQRGNPDLSSIPVVVCSAYKETAKTLKPDGIIEKPVKLEDLLNTVQRFCA